MFLEGMGLVHADTRVEDEDGRDSTSEEGEAPDPRKTVLTEDEEKDDHDDRSSKVSDALGTEHCCHHESSSVSSLSRCFCGLTHVCGGACLLDNNGHSVSSVGLIRGSGKRIKGFGGGNVGIIGRRIVAEKVKVKVLRFGKIGDRCS